MLRSLVYGFWFLLSFSLRFKPRRNSQRKENWFTAPPTQAGVEYPVVFEHRPESCVFSVSIPPTIFTAFSIQSQKWRSSQGRRLPRCRQ